jgi:DNA-damage-inducible protein D
MSMAENKKAATSVALFQEKTVRRVWYQDRWYFSIIDVIEILTDSERPRKYWSDLKVKLVREGYIEVSEKIGQLKMEAPDGKMRVTDAADTTTLLRIIQSVPSPKAEPFKRWLAEVGTQRLEEIENPEKAMERMRALYEQKGYPQTWIDARMRGIAVRNDLTAEWEERGAKEGIEYAILTNEIAKATFGVSIQARYRIQNRQAGGQS